MGGSPIAIASVSLSALLGEVLDKKFGTGCIAPFILMCLLGNLHLVPSADPFYDAAAGSFLPRALVLILLNSVTQQRDGVGRRDVSESSNDRFRTVGLAYALGAVTTLFGSWLGFQIVTTTGNPVMRMEPYRAAQTAGCLAATYVGGSLNFFAVANAVGLSAFPAFVGALCAADVVLMALYLVTLEVLWRLPSFRRLFPGDNDEDGLRDIGKDGEADNDVQKEEAERLKERKRKAFSVMRLVDHIPALVFLLACTEATLRTAGLMEKMVSWGVGVLRGSAFRFSAIPGLGTACLVLSALGIGRGLKILSKKEQKGWMKAWLDKAPLYASLGLSCFFASIGASARASDLKAVGPACVVFTAVALLVHTGGLFLGTGVINKLLPGELKKKWRVPLGDLLVASNANVGGPSTAAAMAGVNMRRDDLVLPATLFGTLGYAFGTLVGFSLFKLLCRGIS